jgi:hypothetical protein
MKIHYDNGNFYTMVFSGRHTICLCGKWLQDNYEKDSKRKTKYVSKVTCKNCLKKLKDKK